MSALVKHMVDRFLQWKLPKTFSPDGGIIYSHTSGGIYNAPVGTNLFTAAEATEMVRHMLEGAPALPIPMLLWCPQCKARHIDVDEFEEKPHHTHACQACGMVWRPAIEFTVGVQFLPGFKNE